MTSNVFQVDDYYELLALHRALLEAKFCDEPNDLDVSASPLVATLHRKLLKSLIKIEVDKKGLSAQNDWDDWLTLRADRREWIVGLKRVKNLDIWDEWSNETKKKYVLNLLSPFYVSDELVNTFLVEVKKSKGETR